MVLKLLVYRKMYFADRGNLFDFAIVMIRYLVFDFMALSCTTPFPESLVVVNTCHSLFDADGITFKMTL